MSKKAKNKPKTVIVTTQLLYPNGVTIKSLGSGKLKGGYVRVTIEPTILTSKEAVKTTYNTLGDRVKVCEDAGAGKLKVV